MDLVGLLILVLILALAWWLLPTIIALIVTALVILFAFVGRRRL